jgi:hypothetical protein
MIWVSTLSFIGRRPYFCSSLGKCTSDRLLPTCSRRNSVNSLPHHEACLAAHRLNEPTVMITPSCVPYYDILCEECTKWGHKVKVCTVCSSVWTLRPEVSSSKVLTAYLLQNSLCWGSRILNTNWNCQIFPKRFTARILVKYINYVSR